MQKNFNKLIFHINDILLNLNVKASVLNPHLNPLFGTSNDRSTLLNLFYFI